MRGAGIKIGRIFGITIYLHSSWFFIFALMTYYFAGDVGTLNPRWSPLQHWTLGVVTSLLFFGSVLFHELSHSVVARHYRLPVSSITLFIFGGVASITREPDSAGQEFLIAAAGPFSSFVLAAGFLAISRLTPGGSAPNAIGDWLGKINASLAIFNLLPGFPLDGGRVFRSIVWGFTKNYQRATRIAARTGQVVAYAMMGLGTFWAVQAYGGSGDPLNGLWLVFIGWFLLTAARQSYAQVTVRGVLAGLRVADIMTADLPSVGRDMTLEEYGREAARTGRRAHLVISDGQLIGLMTAETLQNVPREEWDSTSVQAVMLSADHVQRASLDEPALQMIERMGKAHVDQMAVFSGSSVVGLVTRDSIQRVVQTRSELGHAPGQ